MKPNPSAEQQLIHQHAPLVSRLVEQFEITSTSECSREQLHNFGLVALLRAARQFPDASPLSFESFARIQIQRAMLREIQRTQHWFRRNQTTATSNPALA